MLGSVLMSLLSLAEEWPLKLLPSFEALLQACSAVNQHDPHRRQSALPAPISEPTFPISLPISCPLGLPSDV